MFFCASAVSGGFFAARYFYYLFTVSTCIYRLPFSRLDCITCAEKIKDEKEATPGRGSDKKMRKYSVNGKRIFLMSLPIFAELFLQLMVGNVDQIMLSGYSSDSVAAIGNANTVINLVIVILTMASSGGMIALTHYIGANDTKKMKDAVIWTFVLSGAFGLVFTVISVSAATPLLYALNAPEEIIGQASGYITVVGAGLIIQAAQLAGTAVLRSFSRLKEILIIAVVMNLTNILGNWLLINGIWIFPEYGILGAAISTDVSKLIGLLITLAVMIKRVPVKVRFSDFKALDAATFKDIVKIALPTGGETASYNLSQIVVLSFINIFGTAVINTKVYCSMLANVAYLYSLAIAQSTQINIGYLVGAGEYSTVSSRVAKTTAVCIGVSVAVTAILWLSSDYVLGFLTSDVEVLELAKSILLIEIALETGRSVNIVMTRCLATVGDINFPVTVTVIMEWAVEAGIGYLLGVKLGYGLKGIWIAMAADEILRGIFFAVRFARKKWMHRTPERAFSERGSAVIKEIEDVIVHPRKLLNALALAIRF